MMILVPFLVSLMPGLLILALTWWFTKRSVPTNNCFMPGILGLVSAIIIFYIGFVEIRGFEGGMYGLLSVFLLVFSAIALQLARKVSN